MAETTQYWLAHDGTVYGPYFSASKAEADTKKYGWTEFTITDSRDDALAIVKGHAE